MQKRMIRKGIVIGILLLFLGASVISTTGVTQKENKENVSLDSEPWWNEDWRYRKEITIGHAQVDDDLEDFPVLISHTSTDFVGHAQDDGDDFVFIDETNVIQYNHEIEDHDSGTGELVAWVNIPDLDADQDTVFWVYYGNADCDNQQNPDLVWDSNYVMVHHLTGLSASELNDSTMYNNDISGFHENPDYNIDSKIAKGVDLDGVDRDYIYADDSDNLDVESAVTLEAWIKIDSFTNDSFGIIGKWWDGSNRAYGIDIKPDGEIGVSLGGSTVINHNTTDFEIESDVWYHIAMSWDESNVIGQVFKNGVASVDTFSKSDDCGTNSDYFYIGRMGEDSIANFNGIVDEVRISNIGRSSSWILTEYNNQHDPESFLTFGEEQEYSYEIESVVGGIGVQATVANTGSVEVVDLVWEIHIVGGLFGLIDKTVTGTIDDISTEQSVIIQSGLFIGLGGIEVTVTVNDEEIIEHGQQLIIFTSID